MVDPSKQDERTDNEKKIDNLIERGFAAFYANDKEKEIYKKGNVPADYVGHPLVERIEGYNFLSRSALFNNLGLEEEKEILLVSNCITHCHHQNPVLIVFQL